ncbi:PREDICTED: uncharacterized protein LOC104782650 [Camelina sativa]|uniref:Uncharacterized protein LOC104782650 n=1 Tax=Camelina sativa TaxID=90675 RepID=A0ABM0YU77_CAMSA|nr:PREDICTED: uncharacterized protein LOC104782650 [Camelina sativa]
MIGNNKLRRKAFFQSTHKVKKKVNDIVEVSPNTQIATVCILEDLDNGEVVRDHKIPNVGEIVGQYGWQMQPMGPVHMVERAQQNMNASLGQTDRDTLTDIVGNATDFRNQVNLERQRRNNNI